MNTFYSSSAGSEREARLCAFAGDALEQVPDTIKASREIMKNKDISQAWNYYNEAIRTKDEYAMLTPGQPDRTYFFALLMNGMLRGEQERQQYASLGRKDIRVADPFGASDKALKQAQLKFDSLPESEEKKNAAEALRVARNNDKNERDPKKKEQTRKALKEAQEKFDTAPESAEKKKLRAEIDTLQKELATQGTWEKGENPGYAINVDRTIRQYLEWKKQLDGILRDQGISVSQMQAPDAVEYNRFVTREEYFRLLLLLSRGEKRAIEEAATRRVSGLRGLFDKVQNPNDVEHHDRYFVPHNRAVLRAQNIYRDLAVDTLGPDEVLSSAGIDIGPNVRRRYARLSSGEERSPQVMRPGESAATWEMYPDGPRRAYAFLTAQETGFPNTESNRRFLASLKYFYTVPEGPKHEKAEIEGGNGLSRAAVDANLKLVVQSLMESQNVVAKGAEERSKLKNQVSFTEKLEKNVGGYWEYIKDYHDHPAGSLIAATAGLLVVKGLYRMLFKNKSSNLTRYLAYAAIVGTGVGLYQQHEGGKAWWEDTWKTMQNWWDRDHKLSPDEQTFSNYWARECKINDRQKRDCLSLVEPEDSCSVMQWYGRMNQEMQNGGKNLNRPDLKLPFKIDPQTRSHVFGQKTDQEIAQTFYATLHDFFQNRGESIKKEGGPLSLHYGLKDPAAVGYDYIMDRYVKRHLFGMLTQALAVTRNRPDEIESIDDNGKKIVYRQDRGVTMVTQEVMLNREQSRDMAHDPMWNIFWQEANPETLRRLGKNGSEPANRLEQGVVLAKKVYDYSLGKIEEYGGKTWHMVYDFGQKVWVATDEALTDTANGAKYYWDKAENTWKDWDGKIVPGPVRDWLNNLLPDPNKPRPAGGSIPKAAPASGSPAPSVAPASGSPAPSVAPASGSPSPSPAPTPGSPAPSIPPASGSPVL